VAYVEAMYGRGPLWRAAGRVIDLAMILEGTPPRPVPRPRAGHRARDARLLRREGRDAERPCHVARRITPTDHMLAPGGALAAMLSRLPPDRAMLLPVLMTLVDPCRPLNVEAARNA
jgi:hypothetical protein